MNKIAKTDRMVHVPPRFLEWLNFLLFINQAQSSYDLVTRYFFDQFASEPRLFFDFMRFFKERVLEDTKNHSPLAFDMAQRYLDILSPLCERFGFLKEKSHLDDICFHSVNPAAYLEIDAALADYKKKSTAVVGKILKILNEVVKSAHFEAIVKGRYKNLYSIYRKMRAKRKHDVWQLKDIFAFRIILKNNQTEQCFEVINLLHDRFYPIADFFKDYITIPKINGYQSIHTGLRQVMPEWDVPIEVQVRTQAMDDFTDSGLAAHWLYSQSKTSKLLTEKEKNLISYLRHRSTDRQGVYFLSYTGDLFQLEQAATVLDFAYHLHTKIGDKAKSALVNGQAQPLWYTIREGDRIQVVLSQTKEVKADWLSHVITKYARRKIQEALARRSALSNLD